MNTDDKQTNTLVGIGKYIYWKAESQWMGHWEEYPEHLSRGTTISESERRLLKAYKLLTDIENL